MAVINLRSSRIITPQFQVHVSSVFNILDKRRFIRFSIIFCREEGLFLITGRQLSEMSEMDITRVSAKTLVDIGCVSIDDSLPGALRMESYLKQIKNPYCFLCENTPVKVGFASGGRPLDAKLLDYFIALKNR